jgi:hypothetical protein
MTTTFHFIKHGLSFHTFEIFMFHFQLQQTACGNKNGVCASNLLMVGPLTMKLGTLMYHDERYIETELTSL